MNKIMKQLGKLKRKVVHLTRWMESADASRAHLLGRVNRIDERLDAICTEDGIVSTTGPASLVQQIGQVSADMQHRMEQRELKVGSIRSEWPIEREKYGADMRRLNDRMARLEAKLSRGIGE